MIVIMSTLAAWITKRAQTQQFQNFLTNFKKVFLKFSSLKLSSRHQILKIKMTVNPLDIGAYPYTGENKQPLPLNYETLKRLTPAPLLLLEFPPNLSRQWLQHDGGNQKVMSWAQVEAPEMPVAFHASAPMTNKTNKRKNRNTEPRLNPVCLLRCSEKYFWTWSEVNPLVFL